MPYHLRNYAIWHHSYQIKYYLFGPQNGSGAFPPGDFWTKVHVFVTSFTFDLLNFGFTLYFREF